MSQRRIFGGQLINRKVAGKKLGKGIAWPMMTAAVIGSAQAGSRANITQT